MTNEMLEKMIENVGDSYLDEALDYGEKRITFSKKKLVTVILAAVLTAAIIILPVGAAGLFNSKRVGVFEQKNAVYIYDESVSITAEKVSRNIVKFTVESTDGSYADPYIYAYELKGYYSGATTPYFGNYGKLSGEFTSDAGKGFKVKEYVKDYALYLEKEPYEGYLRPERNYTLIVEGIAAKLPDGSIAELQGEWEVEFRF